MKLFRTSLAAALLIAGPLVAWGQATPAASPSPSAAAIVSATANSAAPSLLFTRQVAQAAPATGGMLQLTIYLVLIAAMLIAGLYLTRGGFINFMQRGKGEKKLLISESRTLGNRQFLVVAEYEGRKMLLGVCPGRIDYLSTLTGGPEETFATELEDKE